MTDQKRENKSVSTSNARIYTVPGGVLTATRLEYCVAKQVTPSSYTMTLESTAVFATHEVLL